MKVRSETIRLLKLIQTLGGTVTAMDIHKEGGTTHINARKRLAYLARHLAVTQAAVKKPTGKGTGRGSGVAYFQYTLTAKGLSIICSDLQKDVAASSVDTWTTAHLRSIPNTVFSIASISP